jgi:phosphonate transport system substrate-binding protein
MKSKSLALLFLLSFCTPKHGPDGRTSVVSEIKIGLLPNEQGLELKVLENDLAPRVQMPVRLVASPNYNELLQAFKRGEVDFALFSGLIFVQAEREAGAKALLKKVYGQEEFYYSAIVVRADSKLQDLSDLRGKRFGFVDPKSTSGYLFPRVMLRKAMIDAGPDAGSGFLKLESEFFGTHEKAITALIEKKVDAVGVWADGPTQATGAWTKGLFEGAKKAKVRVLQFSDPIPNDAFAVREEFFKAQGDVVLRVMAALIELGDVPNGSLKKVFNVDRMATATSRHYDSVRDLELLLKQNSK